jgi:hypothetical protein
LCDQPEDCRRASCTEMNPEPSQLQTQDLTARPPGFS